MNNQSTQQSLDESARSDWLACGYASFNDETQNPADFKKELSGIDTKLKSAAQQKSDPTQSSFLNNLADRFQKAADTGDLSALKPAQASQVDLVGTFGEVMDSRLGTPRNLRIAANLQNQVAVLGHQVRNSYGGCPTDTA